jgi:hypothetical protein
MDAEVNVPKILIAILTTYERQGWPTKDLADWLANLRCNANYAWQHTFCHNFIPAAGARNTICDSFKDCGADWILMIDNDMSPPMNLLDAIKDAPADAMVVVPKFFLWDETNLSLKLCWGWDEDAAGGDCAPKDPATGKVRIESKYYPLFKCGTGAIFVRPEVFQKIPAPWFFYTYDEMKNMTATEDINFCLKLREHGMKIYGYGGMTVGHHHTVNLAALARLLYDVKEEPVARPAAENGEVSLAPQEVVS